MLGSLALCVLSLPLAAAEPRAGEPVDLAEFGTPIADGGIGVEWTDPREVSSAAIADIDDERAPRLRVEWWGSVWPQNGTGGWMRLDDPWNGAWVRIAAPPVKEGAAWRVAFPPLSKEEWEQAGDHRVAFRRTLKLRVIDIDNAPLPRELRLHAFGKAVWAQDSFDIEHKLAADGGLAARIEVANGFIAAIESLPPPRGARVDGAAWSAHGVAGSSAGVRVRLLYADLDDRDSNALTRATIRLGAAPGAAGFSFVPQDVRAEGALWVPDFGTLVALAERAMSWARNPAPTGTRPGRVRQRVAEHAEATRCSAMAGIPRLAPPRDVPIGVPSARQEFFVSPDGDWSIDALSLNTDNGTDAERWAFASGFGNARLRDVLQAALDTRERPTFDGKDREAAARSLEDGHLPLITVTWRNHDLRYRHTLCATALLGDYGDDASRRGDETIVLLTKLTVTNGAEEPRTAFVSLRHSQGDIGLADDGLITLALPEGRKPPEGLVAQRGMISTDEPAGGGAPGWSQARDDKGRPYLTWRAAQALAAIGHGEAERIAREAEAYRQDIERAAREAATRAATARLRDGTSIPYVPSRVFQWRHLTEGWIREALYPALHLATAEVVTPRDPLMTWMLDDLEDRIFFSRQSGYGVADCETAWFERGGVTLQPCLLDTPIVYMARDEIEAALRAFWNSYALLIYPDARCLAEWAPAFGRGGGPLYKTSDEARFVMWLRQLLLWEDGDTLWFGRGMPREWLRGSGRTAVTNAPTTFGVTSFEIEADAASSRIRAIVAPPARNPPRELRLRLRHPDRRLPASVFVNGARIDAERVAGEDIRLFPADAGGRGSIAVTAVY